MTKILHAQVLRLLAATFFVTTAIYGSPSASAQGPQVIALTTPTAAQSATAASRLSHGFHAGGPSFQKPPGSWFPTLGQTQQIHGYYEIVG